MEDPVQSGNAAGMLRWKFLRANRFQIDHLTANPLTFEQWKFLSGPQYTFDDVYCCTFKLLYRAVIKSSIGVYPEQSERSERSEI